MIYERHGIKTTQPQIYDNLRKASDEPMLVTELVEHVKRFKKSSLSACAVKVHKKRMGDILSFVTKNDADAILINPYRETGFGSFTVFTGLDDSIICALDPQGDSSSPVDIGSTKKLFPKRSAKTAGSVPADVVVLITDNKDLFFPRASCNKCKTDLVFPNPGAKIIEFALCTDCDIMWPIKR